MSEKKLERCSLREATHVEMGGKVYEVDDDGNGSFAYKDYEEGHCVGIAVDNKDEIVSIPISLFSILGIKPMRESKREPRECMALTIIAQRNGKDVVALLPSDDFELGMTVRCVEILEDEE